jgi:putative SOS response-associated peptidase YedK
MCGRYLIQTSPDEIRRVFDTVNDTPNWQPTWNMAPTQDGPVIRRHPTTGARNLDLLRWGLLPHWVRGDPKKTRQPINARAETVATAPMFRDAFRVRRCIVPIDGFYEWQVLPALSGPGGKQPHAVARKDGAIMALAGLWEGWRSPEGEVIRSYAVITTTAIDALGHLHERMPVVLEPEDWAAWLGEVDADPAALLRPSSAEFRVWPVSTRVNSVRNNGPELIEPLEPAAPMQVAPA